MKKASKEDAGEATRKARKKDYKRDLYRLQVELVKLQREIIHSGQKILVILEGRDAAGKDGAIKRIVQHLSPREVRVVALAKPSDRDRSTWYFQRYSQHLPAAQELVLFNRSWYNRAGVERVMGFFSAVEHAEFMESVPGFEKMLVRSGVRLFKYYLDISKPVQKERLEERKTNPLKQWKISPIDGQALKLWKQYSAARNEMLARTHKPATPWTIVQADDERAARLNIIRDLLGRLHYKGKDKKLTQPEPGSVFAFDNTCLENGRLAP